MSEFQHQMQRGEVPKIPQTFAFPGVYFIFSDEGDLLYVGESVNVYKRVKKHVLISLERDDAFHFKGLWLQRPTVCALPLPLLQERVMLEAWLIKEFDPKMNVARHSLHMKRELAV